VSGAQPGSKNINWKGGRTVASNGYVMVLKPTHPRAHINGYVYEHIIVAEEKLGRPLEPGELPHHLNGDKADNRPENIEVLPSRLHHGAAHRKRTDLRVPGEANPTISCACGCGGLFLKYDSEGRPRKYLPSHNWRRRTGQ
jgi:hypothetical protein